ncbi:MFS transporter [Saccharopolyspora indica]|uniref:MFS transporter n=1 Tax=Saccharopolyspora indica TaxID=1229659 RepID=UPI0022EA3BD4|nr:MFS transporter [Saccharopolyspora indica]MDA3649771.1 MFS transporter [Saccharopolyspora indica]
MPQVQEVAPPTPVQRPAARPADARRGRWALLITMAATFMAIMDSFIVNVAVPSIRTELAASFTEVELAISGYVLVYGLLLVTGGRLGDLFGFRRLFLVGIAIFTVASLAAGLAWDPASLIAFRVLQAVGAAFFYPQVLSVLQTTFTGAAKAKAFAVFGATIGLASIAGQVVGGLLISLNPLGLSWRWVFLVNIPIGVLTLIGALRVLSASRQGHGSGSGLDLPGVGLLSAALLLLTAPLVQGQQFGWTATTWAMLIAALPAFAGFIAWERRVAARGGNPLVNMALFRRASFSGGIAVAVAFFAGNAGLFFVLTLALQSGLLLSPLAAGLAFAPLAITFAAASLIGPRLTARIGNHTLTTGYAINLIGTAALLMTVWSAGDQVAAWDLVPSLAAIGFGQGLGVSPLVGAVLGKVPEREAGSASGVLETAGQVGMALGVSVLGLVYFTALGGHEATPADHLGAFTTALTANLALAAAALLLLPLMFRKTN